MYFIFIQCLRKSKRFICIYIYILEIEISINFVQIMMKIAHDWLQTYTITAHLIFDAVCIQPKNVFINLARSSPLLQNIPSIFLASFKYEKMTRKSCLPFTTYNIGTIAHVSNCLFNTPIWKKTITILKHFQPSNYQIIGQEKWI